MINKLDNGGGGLGMRTYCGNKIDYCRGLELGIHMINKLDYWRGLELGIL